MRRVLWKDGDVVTEKHFDALEDWVERLAGWHFGLAGHWGLFRGPKDLNHNQRSSVQIVSQNLTSTATVLGFALRNIRLLTSDFRAIEVRGPVSLELRTEVHPTAPVPVYLEIGVEKVAPDESYESPIFWEPDAKLTARPSRGDAFQIGEVRWDAGAATLATDFIPPCVTMSSCEAIQERARDILSELEDCANVARESLPPLLDRARDEMEVKILLELARLMMNQARPALSDLRAPEVTPGRFFQTILTFARTTLEDARMLRRNLGPSEAATAEAGIRAEADAATQALDTSMQDGSGTREICERAIAALQGLRRYLGWLFGSLPREEFELNITGVKLDSGQMYDDVHVYLAQPLAMELSKLRGRYVLVRINCASPKAAGQEVRIDPREPNVVKIKRHETLKPLDNFAKGNWYRFAYEPNEEDLSSKVIKFHLDRKVGVALRSDLERKQNIQVLGSVQHPGF